MNNLIAAQEELQNKRNIWALAVIEDVLVPGRASHQRFLSAAMAMNAALRAEKAIYDNLLGTVEPRDIPRPPDDWYNDAFDNAYRTIGQDRLTQAVYSKVAMISNNLARNAEKKRKPVPTIKKILILNAMDCSRDYLA